VLAVSTDPAHSLGDALSARLAAEPRAVRTRRGTLSAAELAAGPALARFRQEHRAALRQIAARGTYLDEDDVDRLLSLALPGADELIAWLEVARLTQETGCDEVVVDAAPTAHTLRLLAMPEALRRLAGLLDRMQERHRLMAEHFGGVWRPDDSDALIADLEVQAREIGERLRDAEQTALVWVMLPEALALAETRDSLAALDEAGLPVREVIVNRILPPDGDACPLCDERRRAEAAAIREIREALADRRLRFVPEEEREPRGRVALRRVAGWLESSSRGVELLGSLPSETSPPDPLSTKWRGGTDMEWLDEIAPPGLRLLFFGGKGGVGKTTCSAAVALALAERRPEARILLLSTDPAHSLADVLEVRLGDDERPVPGATAGLRARELDAGRAFAAWRDRYGRTVGGAIEAFTAEGAGVGDILDLTPPGLDELIALATLLDAAVEGGEADLVVVDTAPTGHALRLLEMPRLALAWDHYLLSLLLKYREAVGLGELAAELVELSRGLKRLQALLRDGERARFVAVTRAAELPRRETVRLLRSLGKLGIDVAAVVVNALAPDGCARCGGSAGDVEALRVWLAGLRTGRCAIIKAPAAFPPPRGVRRLADWARTWEKASA
jgi:arsenite/tail-anchored protein-transporting ATPase